jgi:2-phosphoglycerate kinase
MVISQPDGDRTPFLRGILVQSLMNVGLSFDEAYQLAQTVRDNLRDTEEITSAELKQQVSGLLEADFGGHCSASYLAQPSDEAGIVVHTPTRSAPFSAGLLAHSLESCAIEPDVALEGARKVYAELQKTGHREIDHKALRKVIYLCLRENCSATSAERYLSWRRFENSGTPLIVLIGGVSGAGKSTISSEVAYRMDIGRIQSTDMMREIIRAYLTPEAVPTLGYSSFEAWRGLATTDVYGGDAENPVITGFLSQFLTMKPALGAAVGRAVKERHDLIIEGVHIAPTLLDLAHAQENAIVVCLMLAVMEKTLLEKQLMRRGRERSGRKASRYLERIDDIWELQSYLLSEADNGGVPIITNRQVEATVREVMKLIVAKVMKRYPPAHSGLDWNGPPAGPDEHLS